MALGVLGVGLAYAGGRWHDGWAPALYWIGEITVFSPAAFVALSGRSSWGQRAGSVLIFAGAQSAITSAYSPTMFRYSDELQNYRALLNVLLFHHDFHLNYSLPVSSAYPGLQDVTAAMTQTTRLSPFVAGLILASIAYILLGAALLLLYRGLGCGDRVAAVAGLVYALGTEQGLLRMFVYEALAVPFLVLALHLATRSAEARVVRPRSWKQLAGLAFGCIAVVTLTHHVTAIAEVGLLALLGVAMATLRHHDLSARTMLLIDVAALGLLVIWIGVVAPTTLSYLGQPLENALSGAIAGHGAGTAAAPGATGGPVEHALSLAGPLLTVVAVPVAIALVWRRRATYSLLSRLWVVGGLLFFAALAVRVLAANGAELGGRMLTYTSLFSSFAIALVVDRLLCARQLPTVGSIGRHRQSSRHRGLRAATGLAVTILFLSGLLSGWPPYYERLPGTFHVDGFESGVDAANVSAAIWSQRALGTGNRVLGDFTAYTLWATLGDQDTVHGDNALYDAYQAATLSPQMAKAFEQLDVRYVETDERLAQQAPVTGSYFPAPGTAVRTKPLPPAALTKFDDAVGVSRIYDNGDIHLYDLRGSRYAS